MPSPCRTAFRRKRHRTRGRAKRGVEIGGRSGSPAARNAYHNRHDGTTGTTHALRATDMTAIRKLLAFDLGAESGRGVLGLFDGSHLSLQVVHRFANTPVRLLDALHWDVLATCTAKC